jgi:hypothetical protein
MKRIISLGRNRYIHLDSYGDRGSSPVPNFLITLLVIALASMTAGALVGIDITNPTGANNVNQDRPRY